MTSASKADYIRTRAQDDAFYMKLVSDYLAKFGSATRTEIDKLLLDKLSEALGPVQRAHKIGNLLSRMRRAGMIENRRARKLSRWVPKE